MGRKPDVLIASYFNRGNKLPDASNRYSFTCKGCGALFPKGRTSHLLDHLIGNTSRCPVLTPDDLASIMAVQATKSEVKAQRTPTKRSAPYDFLNQDITQVRNSSKRQAMHVPNNNSSSFSGLEALAEASRQVERPFDIYGNGRDNSTLDENFMIDPSLSAISSFPDHLSNSSPDQFNVPALIDNMNGSLPPSRGRSSNEGNFRDSHSTSPKLPMGSLEEQISLAANYPVLIAANPNMELGQDGRKASGDKGSKSRSKFTEARREEVRGVRSKRACIRCRMLRKPCSAEDPCTRCSSIKNPRIWSSKCTRGRLADVCTLYSARINTTFIRSRVNNIQQAQTCWDSQETMQVSVGGETENCTAFPITVLYDSLEAKKNSLPPLIILPGDLGYDASEKVRAILFKIDLKDFPPEVQRAIVHSQATTTEAERQLFRGAESLYRCTRFLSGASADFGFSFAYQASNGETEMGSNKSIEGIQLLAFKSMVELLAQQDCHSFLRDLEQALMNRTLPASIVLLSAMMLFFSLDLLEYHFLCQQNLLDMQEPMQAHSSIWSLSESPKEWLDKLDGFSSFMQDLLRCRHITEDLDLDTHGKLCLSSTSEDSRMRDLLSDLDIDQSLLAQNRFHFSMTNVDSLFFKHAARMILSSHSKGIAERIVQQH